MRPRILVLLSTLLVLVLSGPGLAEPFTMPIAIELPGLR